MVSRTLFYWIFKKLLNLLCNHILGKEYANTGAPLSELKSAVLKTLHEFTEKELTHDDVTLIAMEIC